jgi:TPR repeat protein
VGLFGKKKQKSAGDDNAALLAQMMEAFRASDFPQESLPGLQEFIMSALTDASSDPDKLGMVAIPAIMVGDLESVRSLLKRAQAAGALQAVLGISGGAAENGYEALAIEALEAAESMGYADGELDRISIYAKTDNIAAARPLLEKRSQEGDAAAAFILSQMIEDDEPAQAKALLHRAYELGSGDAALRIGLTTEDDPDTEGIDVWLDRAIELGSGVALMLRGIRLGGEDRQAGEPYLRRAIEEFENAEAMRELGVWEREAGNIESALQLFHQAAEAGNTTAMYDLGVYHEHRMERDTAREWYVRGAEAGDEDCATAIGVLDHAEGRGDDNLVEAAEGGSIEAMLHVSANAFRAGDLATARQWAHRAGEAGDPKGYAIEAVYVEQQGDQAEADRLYIMAADLGSVDAMCNLGNNAQRAGDLVAMREWYTKAMDGGHAFAALQLAKFEHHRDQHEGGVASEDLDLDAAVRWYEKAGSLGWPAAYGFLAELGVERNDDGIRDRAIHLGLAAVAGTFDLINVEEVAAANPTTMQLPPRELRERQTVGDSVKLIWRDAMASERMWAKIVKAGGDRFVGYLDNDPRDMTIKQGTLVEFGPEHILELAPSQKEMEEHLLRAIEAGESPFSVRSTPQGVSREIFEETTARAEAGDLEAIRDCIRFYFTSGIPDDPEAVRWLERGAALDDAACLDHLGDHHEREGRMAEARDCWQRGAALGNTDSMQSLGLAAFSDGDIEQAKQWWSQAGDAGHGAAAYNLSLVASEEGNRDAELAWQDRAIELGNADAMYNRAVLFEIEGDLDAARELFERGAASGDVKCRRGLGLTALKQGQTETGLTHLRLAADQDEPMALRLLGVMADARDEKLALFTRAANLGDDGAMDLLGDVAEADANMGDARMWWERAAELGNADSFRSLGLDAYNRDDIDAAISFWDRGIEANPNHGWCLFSRALVGMERDEDSTEMWNLACRAADVGNPQAMLHVGKGLVDDGQTDVGLDLIRRAAEEGLEEAVEFLREHGE